MKNNLDKITMKALQEEYTKWVKANGQGKNKQGVRFGQHIHNNYDCQLKENVIAGGFYDEEAWLALLTIGNDIVHFHMFLPLINDEDEIVC